MIITETKQSSHLTENLNEHKVSTLRYANSRGKWKRMGGREGDQGRENNGSNKKERKEEMDEWKKERKERKNGDRDRDKRKWKAAEEERERGEKEEEKEKKNEVKAHTSLEGSKDMKNKPQFLFAFWKTIKYVWILFVALLLENKYPWLATCGKYANIKIENQNWV